METTVFMNGKLRSLVFRKHWQLLDPDWHEAEENQNRKEPWVDEEKYFSCTLTTDGGDNRRKVESFNVVAILIPSEQNMKAITEVLNEAV